MLLHSKWNYQKKKKNKKAIYWMGEHICRRYDQQGLISKIYTTQNQKTKQPDLKKGRTE